MRCLDASHFLRWVHQKWSDLFRFDHHYKDKQEFYVNQVLGTVNYTTGNDWIDYPQMWLNYQIEHHLIPNLPMTKYQEIQPGVGDPAGVEHPLGYCDRSRYGTIMD